MKVTDDLTTQPIIALDFASQAQVMQFLANFEAEKTPLWVKVGMELFYATGSDLLHELRTKNCNVFLDLKCHDIPHTVYRAMRVLGQLGVQLTTVHAAGGSTMISAAKKGLLEGAELAGIATPPKLLAITQLTSTDEAMLHDEQNIQTTVAESVLHYANVAQKAGADGVVCSAMEAEMLNDKLPADFLKVTPGIRLDLSKADDQKRVMTPKAAAQSGASAIVVGRAITQASDPYAAWQEVCRQWQAGQKD